MIKQLEATPKDLELLAGLAVDPQQLENDHCDYSKVVVRKPWGYEYLIFSNELVSAWILYLAPGAETSMHCHPGKTTSLLVLKGRVVSSTLDADYELQAGAGLRIGKKVFHRTRACAEDGAFVMELETPVNKRDLVRLEDRYGRAGKGYEDAGQHAHRTQNYNYLRLDNPVAQQDQKKRFGECSLTFTQVAAGGLQKFLEKLSAEDSICLLRGALKDSQGRGVLEPGSAISVASLPAHAGSLAGTELEVLIVKRTDQRLKVSDYIVEFLKQQAVKTVFLVPGDANLHLLDSIGRDEQLHFVAHQLEREASLAAEAYAKRSGELGCLVISSGASGPNSLPGVANAWVDSTPLLVISGQARSDQDENGQVRQLGNKAFPIVEVVRPITKYACKIKHPSELRAQLEQALRAACGGRPGPVWLDIPIDIQGMAVEGRVLQGASLDTAPVATSSTAGSKPHALELCSKIAALRDALLKARRPVVLLGNGIRLARAEEQLQPLLKQLQIPVLVSRRGLDLLPDDFPNHFGRPGSFGQRRSNFIIQNCDFLLSVGSRLSVPLIGRSSASFARAAFKVVVDIDAAELCKETIQPNIAIQADAGDFMRALSAQLAPYSPALYAPWIERCQRWTRDFPPLAEGYKHQAALNPYLFIRALSGALAPADCIVVDGGTVLHMAMQVFEVKLNQRVISSTGLEAPGFAVAGAIGASALRGSKRNVFCLCEDRGFQISLQELQTIARHRPPITIFVLRSRGNATVRKIQKDFFGARYVATDEGGEPPRLSAFAAMYGLRAYELASPLEVEQRLPEILAQNGPTLCEVHVDSEQELAPRMNFIVRDDGKWVAKPLEDMYPFLDRDVLKRNMLIELLEEG